MWYCVTMDKFFTSVKLFDSLLERGFYACGTTKQNRKGHPSSLNLGDKAHNRGALEVRMHIDRKMAAVHWMDTKGVHFLSTAANPVTMYGVQVVRNSQGEKKEVPTSPIQLLYVGTMRGVDTQDQLRTSFFTQ
jgi:hypothetical protein